MCDPVSASVAMVSIMAASTVYQTQQQEKMAKAQEESAMTSDRVQQAALQEQVRQQSMQTSEQMSERAVQAMQDHARLLSVSGENGLAATGSVAAQAAQIDMDASKDTATLASNLSMRKDQAAREAAGITANTQSRLNNIKQADWMGAGLQIAGSAASAAYANTKPPAATTPKGS